MLLTLLYNQFNHVFAMLISLLLFKSNNLYQTRPENKSLLQKIAKILSAGGFAPRLPMGSSGWTLPPYAKAQPSPQTPSGFRQLDSAPITESTSLQLQISGFAPG